MLYLETLEKGLYVGIGAMSAHTSFGGVEQVDEDPCLLRDSLRIGFALGVGLGSQM